NPYSPYDLSIPNNTVLKNVFIASTRGLKKINVSTLRDCWTAKQYAERFGFPVLDTFELRGLNEDVKRIGLKIEEL
ncbi:NrdI protein, partial [human gut metagenome]